MNLGELKTFVLQCDSCKRTVQVQIVQIVSHEDAIAPRGKLPAGWKFIGWSSPGSDGKTPLVGSGDHYCDRCAAIKDIIEN